MANFQGQKRGSRSYNSQKHHKGKRPSGFTGNEPTEDEILEYLKLQNEGHSETDEQSKIQNQNEGSGTEQKA